VELTIRPLQIGSVVVDPPILQAPMAGFTNYAYRQVVRELGGAGLLTTEMVHARGLLEHLGRRGRLPERLWGLPNEPRPLAVQIWDNDPDALAAAGVRLAKEFRVSVIDLNFGCPVKQVTRRARSGAYLLGCPERVGQIVARVAAACQPTPVTAKIRLGPSADRINAIDVCQAIEDAGGAAVTVHGRTAQQLFRGAADWDQIAAIKGHLKRIPLVGNGDLRTAEHVVQAFRRYPVDGVMIGRAGLHRPWLFRQAEAAIRGLAVPRTPSPAEQGQLLIDHFEMVVQRFGGLRGTILMRKYACCYAQGRPGAKQFRRQIVRTTTPAEFIAVVRHYFTEGEEAPGPH